MSTTTKKPTAVIQNTSNGYRQLLSFLPDNALRYGNESAGTIVVEIKLGYHNVHASFADMLKVKHLKPFEASLISHAYSFLHSNRHLLFTGTSIPSVEENSGKVTYALKNNQVHVTFTYGPAVNKQS